MYGGEFGLNYDDGQEIIEEDLGKVQKRFESSKVGQILNFSRDVFNCFKFLQILKGVSLQKSLTRGYWDPKKGKRSNLKHVRQFRIKIRIYTGKGIIKRYISSMVNTIIYSSNAKGESQVN